MDWFLNLDDPFSTIRTHRRNNPFYFLICFILYYGKNTSAKKILKNKSDPTTVYFIVYRWKIYIINLRMIIGNPNINLFKVLFFYMCNINIRFFIYNTDIYWLINTSLRKIQLFIIIIYHFFSIYGFTLLIYHRMHFFINGFEFHTSISVFYIFYVNIIIIIYRYL